MLNGHLVDSFITVTLRDLQRCAWCGAGFAPNRGPGRPRRYCRPSHRQRAYEARRLAERAGLTAEEVLVDRGKLGMLNDRLYVLESAIDDVRADLEESADLDTYRGAVVHLLEAAMPLANAHLEPKATGAV